MDRIKNYKDSIIGGSLVFIIVLTLVILLNLTSCLDIIIASCGIAGKPAIIIWGATVISVMAILNLVIINTILMFKDMTETDHELTERLSQRSFAITVIIMACCWTINCLLLIYI